ncbi:MAG: 1-acyl-sn-glycerol-3-phosphate acyltransferase [Chloroflexi bacterium]|nr:1-acyl-sn-glycerol-3-phosphate acyltransferase [Chloroflexota bacterium]
MARNFLIALVRVFFKVIARVKYESLENLLVEGPTVVVSNHLGRLDALLILSTDAFTHHPNLVVVVAEKYRKYWIYRWGVKVMDFLWLNRFDADVGALREVIRRLQKGGLMVIAPEGTRSADEGLIEGKPGAAYLAARTGATIVPVAVTGTEDRIVTENLRRFKRCDIFLRIGSPFKLPPIPLKNKEDYLKAATDEIMCQIGALLPPSYRGFYGEFPRLKELIDSESDGQ